MKIDALPGLAALDEGRWNGLLDRSRLPSLFLTWQWQTEWSQAFAADRAQQILTATDPDGSLVGALPLYEDGPGRHRIIGGVDVSDYLDLIAVAGREEEIWQALLQHRAGQPGEWDLHGIRAASATVAALPALAPAHGLRVTVERQDRCPVLALPKTWDEYLAKLSGKDRHELRRKMRRLERELPGAAVRSHGDAAGWDEAMTRFLTLHRLSKVGKARFMDERMERFFRDATGLLAAQGLGAALVPRVRGRGGGRVHLSRVRGERRPLQLGIRSGARAARARHRAARAPHPGRHRPRHPHLRLPARRGAVQVRLRPVAGGRLQYPGHRGDRP